MHAPSALALCLLAAAASLAFAQGGGAPANPTPPGATTKAGTMQAVRVHAFGGPDVLKLEDAPRPEPGARDLLVRVSAAGVNPIDWKVRSGKVPFPKEALPFTLGFDVAGVVEAVGAEVEAFKPGDEVFAYMSIQRGGGYAQCAIVKESEAAMKPAKASFEEAAATPLAALTAWQALFSEAGLREGQTVLIHAGAGGVGHFAVQFAHARGAKVIATASEKNHAFLKSIGADVCIDYKAQKFEDVAKDVDVVLDTIGGDTQARSVQCLRKGGFLVSIVQPPSPDKLKEHEVKGAVFLVRPNGAQLSEIAALIDSGIVKVEVSETFTLAQAAKAHEASESGHTRGKIVLKVR